MKIRRFDEVLKSTYKENDYPSERLIRENHALCAFAREFNNRVKEHFTTEEVAAEIERIRKDKKGTGGLPRLGRSFNGPHFNDSDR